MAPEDNVNVINKNSRVVVLKHMFTLKELEEDTSLLLDLKEDVREECSTLGEVTNVVLYDVSATADMFPLPSNDNADRARRSYDSKIPRFYKCPGLCPSECLSRYTSIYLTLAWSQKMNGRFFAGRRIHAELYSGKQRFKRNGTGDDIEGEGDEAEKKRLDDFASWLLTEGD